MPSVHKLLLYHKSSILREGAAAPQHDLRTRQHAVIGGGQAQQQIPHTGARSLCSRHAHDATHLLALPQMPARGEESTERDAQALRRSRVPKAVYPTPAHVPASPAEAPPEPDYDPRLVKVIPLVIPGLLVPGVTAAGPPPPPPLSQQQQQQHLQYQGGAGLQLPPPPPPSGQQDRKSVV